MLNRILEIIKNKKFLYGIVAVFVILLVFLAIIICIKFYSNRIVNIVFTTDENYTEYTKVAIKSAILNKKPTTKYSINIIGVNLSDKKMAEFKSLEADMANINVIPFDISSINHIGNYTITHYVSRADLIKFIMPDIFPELDKILYMDSDTLILKDLAELYNINLGKHPLGAVKLSLMSRGAYHYNCGVILYNLKNWRENGISEKLIKSKNEDTERFLMTQVIFNKVIPTQEIKTISPVYNFISELNPEAFKRRNFKKIYKPYLNKINSYEEFLDNAVIIHYAGYGKPWSRKDVVYADKWWEYAKMINPNWELEPDKLRKKRGRK